MTLITSVVSARHSRLELTRSRHFRKWKLAKWILIFASLHHFEAMIESKVFKAAIFGRAKSACVATILAGASFRI